MNFFRNIASNVLRGSSNQEASEAGGDGSQEIEIDDADLVRRAQAGEYAAFDALVTKHRGKVYAMIMNMVKNDADAWDLAQDSFIKAWRALPKFENRSKFSTWLFRISHNVVYDWMRKKKIRSEGELDDELLDANRIDMSAATAPKQSLRPDEEIVGNELRREIEDALNKLSPQHKETIVLREVQGMDYKEIADVMDCSVGTVMSRLFYARKKLQTLLKP
ncbi:MAG: sigma-70 family RNA polymerase sigma factor [Akkermansiaceae bacterium]